MNNQAIIDPFFLPKRNTRPVGGFPNSQQRNFITNFYDVKLHPNLNKIYVYEAKFPSDIPNDSSQLFTKCLHQIKTQMRSSIGYICFSGKVVYGTKQSKIPVTHQAKIAGNPIQVTLKYTKQLAVIELLQNYRTRPMTFQFLNSKLKSCMRHANICQLGKAGQFYQKDQLLRTFKKEMQNQYNNLERAGLNVLRGYRFTLMMVNRKLKLQLDVCSRVLQKNNLQEDFLQFVGTKQELAAAYKGATIITRYGNYRTYKIQQIDFKLSPCSTFQQKGQIVSFQQYFKKAYNADIYDTKQPLLKVLAQMKKQINKNQSMEQKPQYIYLVPQLVSLTGMKDEQRANFQSMKALAPFTKLDPCVRFQESYKILDTLNEAKDILEIGKQVQMKGSQLRDPIIRFREIANLRGGAISNRGELFKSHTFLNWMFVYSKFSQQDYNEAVQIQNFLRQASQAYGIQYKQPKYIQINHQKYGADDFCQKIKQNLTENRKLQLIFIILRQRQTTYYGRIKDFVTNQLDIPCQVVQTKSFSKAKGVLSVASKIAIQMSCKAGDAPWVIENQIPYFKSRNFAYSAISSSKGRKGFTLSFIGTINNSCTEVYSNYVLGIHKKEKIDGILLKIWFVNWIKKYYMKNGKLPETLLLYRESVGDSLIKYAIPHEIQQLKNSIEDVKKKAKVNNYNPQIIYIVVNKKVNSRFFAYNKNQVFNPEPGSVVVEQMSIDDRFDFHLVAQKVTQGTSTPSHYRVVYDNSNIPQEDLIRFTYQQCYNYYNWQGSVKVPACLQCANKLSKLAGQSIQRPFVERKETKVNQTFFFL